MTEGTPDLALLHNKEPLQICADGLKWSDAKPPLLPGAKIAVLEGNPKGAVSASGICHYFKVRDIAAVAGYPLCALLTFAAASFSSARLRAARVRGPAHR